MCARVRVCELHTQTIINTVVDAEIQRRRRLFTDLQSLLSSLLRRA